jgi:hypothetical protein
MSSSVGLRCTVLSTIRDAAWHIDYRIRAVPWHSILLPLPMFLLSLYLSEMLYVIVRYLANRQCLIESICG